MSNDGFAWMGEQRRSETRRPRSRAAAALGSPQPDDKVEQLRGRVVELETALAMLAALSESEGARHDLSESRSEAWAQVPRALSAVGDALGRARIAVQLTPRQWLSRARWRRPAESMSGRLRRGVRGLLEEALATGSRAA